MKIDFAGQIVVVAGGTGGLGKAVSLAFLSEGAKTVVTYRTEDEFLALKEAAGSNGSLLEGYWVNELTGLLLLNSSAGSWWIMANWTAWSIRWGLMRAA